LTEQTQQDYQISVKVIATYLPDQSDPKDEKYVFSYRVHIQNTGKVAAQLISRHWIIHDANNEMTEVKGLGVVGEQPLLEANAYFEYVSGTLLKTPNGTMMGYYFFTAVDGHQFTVEIPMFNLSVPGSLH
jgi:ApaG protein